ncbi:MAG: ABC transporter permease subunit [Nitrososphaerales archaeon]
MRPSGPLQIPAVVILLILVGSAMHLQFNPISIFKDLGNSAVIIQELLSFDVTVADKVAFAIVETIEMALIGTVIGFILAVPASLIAAKNTSPIYLSIFVKGIINILWSIPALLSAIVLVVVVGLGPTAGILALALYTLGFSGKYLYEIYESQNPSAYDVVKVAGAGRLQVMRYVTLPEASPYLVSQFLFMLSYNIKNSSILGLVGAGGIGFYVIHYLESLQYGKASMFLLAVVLTIIAMDWLSTRLRRQLAKEHSP